MNQPHDRVLDCGCHIANSLSQIAFCSLHRGAPDMYKALQHVSAWGDHDLDCTPHLKNNPTLECDCYLSRVRTALAVAEGNSNGS